jgi:hypothetical protein
MSTGPTAGRGVASSAAQPSATTGSASGPRSTRPPSRPAVAERPDGTIEVTVHLVARDKAGELLSDGEGRHVYEFRGDLVERMTIEA